MGALEGWGLAEVSWEACDARIGPLTASPEDAEGRGIALTVARDGEASDLTGATVALAWRHRATRRRGCDAFAAVDAAGGRFRIHYPRALAGCEGTVDARIVVSDGDSQISTLPFEIEVGRALGGGSESDEGWGCSPTRSRATRRRAPSRRRPRPRRWRRRTSCAPRPRGATSTGRTGPRGPRGRTGRARARAWRRRTRAR